MFPKSEFLVMGFIPVRAPIAVGLFALYDFFFLGDRSIIGHAAHRRMHWYTCAAKLQPDVDLLQLVGSHSGFCTTYFAFVSVRRNNHHHRNSIKDDIRSFALG